MSSNCASYHYTVVLTSGTTVPAIIAHSKIYGMVIISDYTRRKFRQQII